MESRPFAHLRTPDQWARAAHAGTALDPASGGVRLALREPAETGPGAPPPALAGGLAFDAGCRAYRSVPAAGRVDRHPRLRGAADGIPLFAAAAPAAVGDFTARATTAGPLREPRALAIDADDRLWIAETQARRLVIVDVWRRRVLARPGLPGRPLDIALDGRRTAVLLEGDGGVAEIESRAVRRVLPLPAGLPAGAVPARMAADPVAPGHFTLLLRGAARQAWIAGVQRSADGMRLVSGPEEAPGATDLEWLDEDTLVIARGPGQDFARRSRNAAGTSADVGLSARGYDGLGIARAPGGGIAYGAGDSVRLAVRARPSFRRAGKLTSYRLDSHAPGTRWGRLFLSACIPAGTQVRARFSTSDEPSGRGEMLRTPPEGTTLALHAPELSPPLPWAALLAAADPRWNRLIRRAAGHEQPWVRTSADDDFETYETPVAAPPGRYLWVTLELRGTEASTPRVRSLRAEHPAHDHLTRLPRAFSRDEPAADFLQRYLALPDGLLSELAGRADQRATMLTPSAAPAEALGWLSGFLGLVLDERWPEDVRRRVVAEGAWLMRHRGTLRGLSRLLELIVGREVTIVERWRLRGVAGALMEGRAETGAAAVVGGSLRVGGAVGATGTEPVEGDAFATHAHRFTVLVPVVLGEQERAMVEHALALHRPAHTLSDLCTLGTGMRVGHGLHVGLHSAVGHTGGWKPLTVDHGVIGKGIVGRPVPGAGVGTAATGRGTRVG